MQLLQITASVFQFVLMVLWATSVQFQCSFLASKALPGLTACTLPSLGWICELTLAYVVAWWGAQQCVSPCKLCHRSQADFISSSAAELEQALLVCDLASLAESPAGGSLVLLL